MALSSHQILIRAGHAVNAFCDSLTTHCDEDEKVSLKQSMIIGSLALKLIRQVHSKSCAGFNFDFDDIEKTAQQILDFINAKDDETGNDDG